MSMRPRPRDRGQARVRDLLRQPDVDVQPERRRDLVLEELPQAAMPRIDAAHQLAFVEPERDARDTPAAFPAPTPASDAPARPPGDRDRRRRSRSTGSSSANSPAWCARSWRTVMRSLPCCANSGQYVRHPLVVVEPAAGVGDGERHGGQALRRRVDDHHGVLLPRLARLLVANAAPEIDDLLAAVVGAARAAQLPAVERSSRQTRRARPRSHGLTCPPTSGMAPDIVHPDRNAHAPARCGDPPRKRGSGFHKVSCGRAGGATGS